jgi:hypothetical protein
MKTLKKQTKFFSTLIGQPTPLTHPHLLKNQESKRNKFNSLHKSPKVSHKMNSKPDSTNSKI